MTTGNAVVDSLKVDTDTFTFKIPESHPSAKDAQGNRVTIEKEFTFQVVTNDEEALAVMAYKQWSLVEIINDILKANARSSAYQTALAAYQTSEVPAEKIRERMIKDFIRLGMSESAATAAVDSALASK